LHVPGKGIICTTRKPNPRKSDIFPAKGSCPDRNGNGNIAFLRTEIEIIIKNIELFLDRRKKIH